ncbi:MAG: hypothetical protein WCP59_18015 [Actinomycetota bacterium]
MDMSPPTDCFGSPEAVTDDDVAAALVRVSHLFAARGGDRDERAFAAEWLDQTTNHPTTAIVAELAARGSLAMLRRLVVHPDPYIRWVAAHNPFAIDADIQLVLAADPDPRVVTALVEAITLTVDACMVIAAGPHSEVKRTLAARPLGDDLLDLLAADRDRVTARCARGQLSQRRPGARQGSTNTVAA